MVKDSEFHFGSRKKTLSSSSNAGGKIGFDGSGKMGSRPGKRSLSVTESLLRNGLGGTSCGNSMVLKLQVTLQEWWLCHQVDRCDVTGLLGLQKAGKQQVFLMSPAAGNSLSQVHSCAKLRPCPQDLPKGGLHGVSQRPLSSVSAVPCMLRVRQAGPSLAFGNRDNGRADIWAWSPTGCLCVRNRIISTCNCTFKSLVLKYRSSWEVLMVLETHPKPCIYIFLFSILFSKVRLLF